MRFGRVPAAAAAAVVVAGVAAAAASAQGSDAASGRPAQPGNSGYPPGQTTQAGAPGHATQPGTTAGAPGQGITPVGTAPPGQDLAPAGASRGALRPASPPVLGASVTVAPAQGTVLVRLPHQGRFLALGRGAELPTGTVVDAARGRITLTSAIDTAGHTQTATFWGGTFVVRQARGRRSPAVLTLSGERPALCRASHPKHVRILARIWGHDHHGLFSTRGRYASAAVRGTVWLTEDRCDGTLIAVAKGAVLVTDPAHHRKTLVRAGHRYLARARP